MSLRTETFFNSLTKAGVEKGLALTAAELLSAEVVGLVLTPAQRGIVSQAHEQIIAALKA